MPAVWARQPIAVAMIVVAAAIAACTSAAGSSPTPSPSIATGQPSPASSRAPTGPPVAELCPSQGVAATGPEVAITDPDVTMHAAAGWTPVDIAAYRAQLQQFVGAVNDPALTKMGEWQMGLIDSNVMRTAAAGQSQPSGAQTFLIVSVLPTGVDLKATVDARLADEATNGLPTKVLELGPTELPIGPAYCVGMVSDSAVGIPSQTIEYIAALDDGRAISMGATAPRGDAPFADLMRSVALTLAPG